MKVVRSTTTSRIAMLVFIAVVAVLALAPQWGDPSTLNTLVRLLTLLCLAQMWNLLAGYAGLVSVGQQAFVGIGAYTLVYFGNVRGLNIFLCVPLAGVIAAVLALPIAGAAFRLRGGYFAIGTWVIAEVVRLVVSNIDVLGGGRGTSLTAVIGIDVETRQHVTYWLALAAGAGSVLVVWWLLRSPLGTALRAVRDSDQAAAALGVRVTRAKLIAFVVSAAGCAIAGAIIYLNLLRVQPSAAFSINWTVYMIFIVVIGGLGTIEGPIVGTLLFFALQEWLSDAGAWYLIILGVLAIVITIRMPNGIYGWFTQRTGISLFPVGRRLEVRKE
jgi:branched-chain amino acid transport system permease protein